MYFTAQVEAVLAENLTGKRMHTYNNYGRSVDKAMLGIGSTSQQISW
jgi:hypothetical protein